MKKQKYRNTYQRQLRFSLTITFGWTVLDLVLVLAKVSYPFVEVASVATVMFAFGALAAMSALEAFTDEETERQEKMLFHLNDCLSILQPVTETVPVETGEIVYWRYEPEEVER